MKKSFGLESTMLAVYILSSKKRNVLVDPNKYEYNLQSMSREPTINVKGQIWNCVEKRKHSKCVATAVVTLLSEVAVGEIKNFTAWGNCCWGN